MPSRHRHLYDHLTERPAMSFVLRFASAIVCLLLAAPLAADETCHHCGCRCQDVAAYCYPSCDHKEVKETVYEVVCEDFCVPGCSHARKCTTPCGDCQTVWEPSCGRVRTRQKLVKKEITKLVPVTKCTVVYLCPRCCQACNAAPVEGLAANPAAPHHAVTVVPRIAVPSTNFTAPPVRSNSFWTALAKRNETR